MGTFTKQREDGSEIIMTWEDFVELVNFDCDEKLRKSVEFFMDEVPKLETFQIYRYMGLKFYLM